MRDCGRCYGCATKPWFACLARTTYCQETGNRKQETETETGNRKQETGNRKQETGNRKQETDKRKEEIKHLFDREGPEDGPISGQIPRASFQNIDAERECCHKCASQPTGSCRHDIVGNMGKMQPTEHGEQQEKQRRNASKPQRIEIAHSDLRKGPSPKADRCYEKPGNSKEHWHKTHPRPLHCFGYSFRIDVVALIPSYRKSPFYQALHPGCRESPCFGSRCSCSW